MVGYSVQDGGLQVENGGLSDESNRAFYDSFDPGMMNAYYDRATAGTAEIQRAGYHTVHGLYLDGLNYLWTVPGSGFPTYPDTGPWVIYVFTIGAWSGDDQIWLPTFGDSINEGDRGPCFEIQFNLSVEDYRIQARDENDNRTNVASDDQSGQSFAWLSEGQAYAVGIRRFVNGSGNDEIRGALWEATADYPDESEALAVISSEDHPTNDWESIGALATDSSPGRWGVRTGNNTDMRLHEVERAEVN